MVREGVLLPQEEVGNPEIDRKLGIVNLALRKVHSDVYSSRSLTDYEVLDTTRKIIFYRLVKAYLEEDRDLPLLSRDKEYESRIKTLEKAYADTRRGDYRSSKASLRSYGPFDVSPELNAKAFAEGFRQFKWRIPDIGEVLPTLPYPYDDPRWIEEYESDQVKRFSGR